MNAVIDEDLHRSLGEILTLCGFQVFDIRDHHLRGSSDDKIFEFAKKQRAVLFTGDLGFSNIIRFPIGNHSGICILRFPNELSTNSINLQVKNLMNNLKPDDYKGNLIILSSGKIRIRRHQSTTH